MADPLAMDDILDVLETSIDGAPAEKVKNPFKEMSQGEIQPKHGMKYSIGHCV